MTILYKNRFFAILFTVLTSLSFSSCAQHAPLGNRENLKQDTNNIHIIYSDVNAKECRVYINSVESKQKKAFRVKSAKVTIQIVRKHETASIDMLIKKDAKYTLRVLENYQGKIEIIEIAN